MSALHGLLIATVTRVIHHMINRLYKIHQLLVTRAQSLIIHLTSFGLLRYGIAVHARMGLIPLPRAVLTFWPVETRVDTNVHHVQDRSSGSEVDARSVDSPFTPT